MNGTGQRTFRVSLRSLTAGLLTLAAALVPATAAAQTLAIEGGTVHPVSGPSYVGTVVVRDGLIEAAGAEVGAPADAEVIDAAGLHVYPGLFNAFTSVGLVEIAPSRPRRTAANWATRPTCGRWRRSTPRARSSL